MLVNKAAVYFLSVLAIFSIVFIVMRHRTILLGFTVFSFINIARTGLAAFIFGSTFSLNEYYSPFHLQAFFVTALGLISFSVGIWVSWRPLRQVNSIFNENFPKPWLNHHLAILFVLLGSLIYLTTPIAFRIPTIRAVWSNFHQILNIGVLIGCVYGLVSQHYKYLFFGLGIFCLNMLIQAVLSGHIYANSLFLVQIFLVISFWKKVNIKSLIIFITSALVSLMILTGWLDSRQIIRSGALNGLSVLDRSKVFLRDFNYVNPLNLEPSQIQSQIRQRIDMSDILAAQMSIQPNYVPYAYGKTVFPEVFEALVPRFLWPDKPFRAGGSDFVTQYTGLHWSEETSVGLTYQFELYANAGIGGVIIGLFFIGWITAKLELGIFMRDDLTLTEFLTTIIVLATSASGEKRFVVIIISMLSGVIGMIVLGKLLELLNVNRVCWQDTTDQLHRETHYRQSQYLITKITQKNR